MPLLEVEHLKKYFPVKSDVLKKVTGYYKAVNDVSFSIEEGKTFGLVGESGCGKTTTGKAILRLIEPTDGIIRLNGHDVMQMNKKELRLARRDMQIIFQDPFSSLNPMMTVEQLISEPIREHNLAENKADLHEKVLDILNTVGLNSRDVEKYPHEFSGGQRQRIMIARALSVQPKLVVCDEPVSALDVSIQAQILNLMQDLQDKMGVSYLFIAHGMPVVQHVSDNIGVMYLGNMVEVADKNAIFANSLHPYTQALMSAIPSTDPDNHSKRVKLSGEVPSLINLPNGCLFSKRCPKCTGICNECVPPLREIEPRHLVACHNI